MNRTKKFRNNTYDLIKPDGCDVGGGRGGWNGIISYVCNI